jgi:hypothetical protein
MSLKRFGSHTTNQITMLQYKCSLLAIFPLFLTGNFSGLYGRVIMREVVVRVSTSLL